MNEMIFIDSTAFVALNDKQADNHTKVVEWVKSMLSKTIGLSTSLSVVSESASILKKKVGFKSAKRFLDLLQNPGIQFLDETKEIQQEAWTVFLQTEKNQEITFEDCLKVKTMHYYGIMKILSFNKGFDQLQVMRIPR